jgi:hypothetical protein
LKCPWFQRRPVKEVAVRRERQSVRGLLSQPGRKLSKMMEFSDSLKVASRDPGKVGGTSGAESENAHVFFSRVTNMRVLLV